MLIDSTSLRPSSLLSPKTVCRTAAIALFTCASTLGLQAQQSDNGQASAPVQLTSPSYRLDLKNVDLNSLDLSYSSSAAPLANTETATLDFKGLPEEATQPPPRRRYGRPRYNDSNHNPDGSPKYAFIAGVGLGGIPIGNLHKYDTASYGFQVGGGRNFNKNFGVLLQFDYDHFGLQGQNLTNQAIVEDPTNTYGIQGSLDGSSHIWSFTLNPTYSVFARESVGAYVVGGVGFYHKVTDFFVPVNVEGYDYYYGPVEYTENETIDHYTSNAAGFNGGFGMTFKPSRFASERFYVEGRYVFVDNQHRPGYNIGNYTTAPATATNLYPANSNRSTYIPIKVGIRF